MTESKFDNFNEFLKRINLTDRSSNSGIFVLDLNEISESAVEEFSLYRNEFYEMNLFNGLTGFRFAIDGTFYEPDGAPALYFIAPNQLQSFEVLADDESATGYLIYIEKETFKKIEKENGINFFKREFQSYYEVSQKNYSTIKYWADLLYNESKLKSENNNNILSNLLTVLLLKIKQFTKEELNPYYSRPNQVIASLYNLIDNKNSLPKVTDCASDLALTPKQLNSITKKVLGKTVTEVIKENFNNRAKALLLQSTFSIKQISQKLGFEEVSNFSRFFKSINKVSPVFYRKQKGAN